MTAWLALLLIPLLGYAWFEAKRPAQARKALLWMVVGVAVVAVGFYLLKNGTSAA